MPVAMPEKKNQHFVPQVHLRGFAIENGSGKSGLIWEYDKQNPDVAKCKSIKKAVCCRPFYYGQTEIGGTNTQKFEGALGRVETAAGGIIPALHDNRTLQSDGKGKLAFYIALLLCRGPAFRDGCRSWLAECVGAAVQSLFPAGALPRMPPELQALLNDGDLRSVCSIDVFPHATLPHLVKAAEQISESLCRKKWEVFFSDKDCFFTSDTPVMFGPARGEDGLVGPGHPNAVVWCPLRKDILVGIRPYCNPDKIPYDVRTASSELVEQINRLMCFAAQRYVYGPVDNEQLRAHVKATKAWCQALSAFDLGGAAAIDWSTRCHADRNSPVSDASQATDGDGDGLPP